jgi:hypothetical protein
MSVVSVVATNRPLLSVALEDNQLQVSWSTHIGWRLESQSNSLMTGFNTNCVTVPNSTLSNSFTVPLETSNVAGFYRLVYP